MEGDGTIWIGQRDGATHVAVSPSQGNPRYLNPKPLDRLNKSNGLSADDVRCILSDHSQSIWLGTYGGGLSRWSHGTFTSFSQTNGLCSDFVRTLYEDSERALWVGTDAGLNRWKDGRFSRITGKEGLVNERINQILEDDCGFFWLCTSQNILRINRAELNALADGRTKRIHPQLFSEADGLPSSEISSFQPGACKGSDGRLWIPTSKGVAVIDPKKAVDPMSLRANRVPPPVVIERVAADEEPIYGHGVIPMVKTKLERGPSAVRDRAEGASADSVTMRLEAGRGRVLEIHYTANSFVAPERIRFEYRLDNHDSDWQDAGNRTNSLLHELATGPL